MARQAAIVVVGAGAAGLAAGIFAAEEAARHGTPARIEILDGVRRIGAKILVSGGGRCNVAHFDARPDDFHGDRRFVSRVLAAFDARAAVSWFESLGVALGREPSGKLFPATDRARTVLDALAGRCARLGVAIRTEWRVEAISVDPEGGFHLQGAGGTIRADRVVLATGGCSLPRSGSDGHGLDLARSLGHAVVPPVPALVPFRLAEEGMHAGLQGIAQPAEVTVRGESGVIGRAAGSLLWTHFGVSGPVVLDASRHWTRAEQEGRPAAVSANLLPGERPEEAERFLREASARTPRRTAARIVSLRIPGRVAAAVLQRCGIDGSRPIAQVTREERRRIAALLCDLPLPVLGSRGWNHAEATAGGVVMREVDPGSMESRIRPGLHLIGEMLDCDGRIGGFNFQWAWSTGYVAGRAVVRKIREET